MLVANAGRLALSMGLHQTREKHNMPRDGTLERQRNIFWIIYILEKGICLRCDRPSMINDDDITISLPPMCPASGEASTNDEERLVLRALSQLAFFESRINSRLVSTKGRSHSAAERHGCVKMLDERLQSWRASLPVSIRPQEEESLFSKRSVNVTILTLAYHHCRIVLNQSSLWIIDNDLKKEPRAWLRQPATCVSSARCMLQCFRNTLYNTNQPFGLLW